MFKKYFSWFTFSDFKNISTNDSIQTQKEINYKNSSLNLNSKENSNNDILHILKVDELYLKTGHEWNKLDTKDIISNSDLNRSIEKYLWCELNIYNHIFDNIIHDNYSKVWNTHRITENMYLSMIMDVTLMSRV